MVRTEALKVSEIFYSLQGESLTSGLPTLFIRLTGCPLRCRYCDTEYAFTGGEWMTLDDILARAAGNTIRAASNDLRAASNDSGTASSNNPRAAGSTPAAASNNICAASNDSGTASSNNPRAASNDSRAASNNPRAAGSNPAAASNNIMYVTVTGGEPLAQRRCLNLLSRLCDEGYRVSLETGGAHDIQPVDRRVTIVMDLKTPGSGEVGRNHYANIPCLKAQDQVKFVIGDRTDYDWAKSCLQEYALSQRCTVLFSPVWQALEGRELAEWILEDQLPVRMQLQLHKLLWGEVRGR